MYRCEALSIAGFIQQLAVAYVSNGYWFYVTGCIPLEKDPAAIDAKLIERYGIDRSKWARFRRKERGLANVQYLRFRQFFVLMATPGSHSFYEKEQLIWDIRRKPLRSFGYSIGCYRGTDGWHASVRIERSLYSDLKKEFMIAAIQESADSLGLRFARLPFEPYSPIRRQVLALLNIVNRRRVIAGLESVSVSALRLRRGTVSPFWDRSVPI